MSGRFWAKKNEDSPMAAVRRLWPWAIALAAVSYALASFDWVSVLAVLARVPLARFMLTEAILISGVFFVCAARWIAVTGLSMRPGLFLQVYVYTSVAIAIGQNTPMQIGEALKIKFAQRSKLPSGRSAISLGMERLVDLAVIADLAGVGVLRHYTGAHLLVFVLALVPLGLLFCVPAIIRVLHQRLAHAGRSSWLGASDDWLPAHRLAILVALTIVKWVFVAVMWQFAMASVGCNIGITDSMLTVSTVSVVSLLSMVPGGFGVQELSVKAILVALGISAETAEAGAIAIRLLTPLMIVLGLVQVPSLLRNPAPLALEQE